MFMIAYNGKDFNSTKASYIKHFLSQCDVLYIQEPWLLRNKLHLFLKLFKVIEKCAKNFKG